MKLPNPNNKNLSTSTYSGTESALFHKHLNRFHSEKTETSTGILITLMRAAGHSCVPKDGPKGL